MLLSSNKALFTLFNYLFIFVLYVPIFMVAKLEVWVIQSSSKLQNEQLGKTANLLEVPSPKEGSIKYFAHLSLMSVSINSA